MKMPVVNEVFPGRSNQRVKGRLACAAYMPNRSLCVTEFQGLGYRLEGFPRRQAARIDDFEQPNQLSFEIFDRQ
jgi:hypothetical protein